jgi:hypothetical protein
MVPLVTVIRLTEPTAVVAKKWSFSPSRVARSWSLRSAAG